ncbi:carbohydrate binding domain-containing protein [Chengkuizengella marina]|uniref:Uncharacterized protein n=1 Tax=Chengkuizengella marina TaxID=2507566 RepID=A0A6N9Q7R2_9BACL|nr:hypothetical protein [Chengkuizengella marina]NBI30907.1 hypothetical protein [Chengkuizengella marina]
MPEQSKNYSLPKPLGHEYMNRQAHNELIDSVDDAIKQAEDNAKNHTDELVDQAEVKAKDAQAETTRNTVHSGFLNLSDFDLSEPNKIKLLKDQVVNVNGYLNTICEGTEFDLPEAPTEGSREDLAFLEFYFPVDSNEMTYRTRTVAGVDFEEYYSDGFSKLASSRNPNVQAQGGGNIDSGISFNRSDLFLNFRDVGLYITGNDPSTTLLEVTADGYVYAIPMFRIKRRNSGGYSASNGNGAREYYDKIDILTNGSVISGEVRQASTFTSDYEKIVVGDTLLAEGLNNVPIKILSKDGDNKVTIQNLHSSSIGDNLFKLKSDRPDNLYSNIIDQRDIIDLRHKVSLTDVDYNKVMNEEFNRLLAGEYENVEMKKEYFGLEKAPSYVEPKLQGVSVKGEDGVTRELTNILGDASFRDNDLGLWSKMNGSYDYTISFEPSNSKEYNSVVLTSHSADPTTSRCVFRSDINLRENQHYIFIADVEVNDGARGEMRIAASNDITLLTGKFETSGKYYLKFHNASAIDDGWSGVYNRTEVGEDGKTIKVNGMRLYEIDQETYNKINVDPEFTGEELVKKLPYVNSYPNVIENLVPPFYKWNIHGNAEIIVPYQLKLNATEDNQHSTIDIPCLSNTIYTFYTKGDSFHIYTKDSSDTTLSYTYSKNLYTFTTESNAEFIRLYATNGASGAGIYEFEKPILTEGEPNLVFVPQGKWCLPYDVANQENNTRFDLTEQKYILSDAQTSQRVTDTINVLSTPQKHIKVTQSVDGTWTVGDTIKVKGYDGIVSGVIDTDTTLAVIIEDAAEVGSTVTVSVNNTEGITVNDIFRMAKSDGTLYGSYTIRVIDVNSIENKLTLTYDHGNVTLLKGYFLVENTADTSTPVVKADGIFGTWTNLATYEATYTIDTPPSDNTADILIEYSVNYVGGNGIEHVPTEVLECEVNGQKLIKSDDGIVTVKANFKGKTAGDTDLVPHIAERGYSSTLLSPYDITSGEADYTKINSLDGNLYSPTTTVNGYMAKLPLKFNIIRVIQDKLGEGFFEGCVTIEDKVQMAKDRLKSIGCNWWGYGQCPNGNKAMGSFWLTDSSIWQDGGTSWSHSSSEISKISMTSIYPNSRVDDNGFVHFLAYTDPSDGVTASTISTDYVELEIQIDVSEFGYDVLVPEEQFPVMTENLLTQHQAFPVDLDSFRENHLDEATNEISDFGVIKTSIVDGSSGAGWYHAVQTPVIPNVTYTMSAEIRSASDVDAALRTELRLGNENVNVDLYSGTLPTEWTKVSRSFTVTNENTAFRFVFYILGTESGTVSYEARNLKLEKGINPNPTWSEGRKSKTTLNYLGKVVGDDVSVPHKFYRGTRTSQDDPSTYTAENTSENYNSISKLDGILYSYTTSTEGNYAQHVFEFDLSHLGLSLFELKDKLRKLSVSWTGYGEGDDGIGLAYGVVLDWWVDNKNWWNPNYDGNKHSSDSPQTITVSNSSVYGSDIYRLITNNQKVRILVQSTHPAGSNSDSIVNTVYIKLDVELSEEVDYIKSNIVKVRKETKEIKLEYPITDYRTGITDNVALWYDHMPVSKPLETTEDVTVLSELGDILISDLSSAVGDKQGVHHWMNPLYRVGNDSLNVFGEFGFANIPLAADSKNVNVGKSIQVNGSGFRDYFITQYGISTLQKPMVGIIGNLVMHENELKLLIVSIYNETGLIDTSQNGVGLLLPIKGKPLVKLEKGERNPAITPNAWRTQTGEIQGYLDQNGELILTYQ